MASFVEHVALCEYLKTQTEPGRPAVIRAFAIEEFQTEATRFVLNHIDELVDLCKGEDLRAARAEMKPMTDGIEQSSKKVTELLAKLDISA